MRHVFALSALCLMISALACGDDSGSGGSGGSGGDPTTTTSTTTKATTSSSTTSGSTTTSTTSGSTTTTGSTTTATTTSTTSAGGNGGGMQMAEVNCIDGIDDDGDTQVDCADSDCDPAAVCGQLVINEIEYDLPGVDSNEFIEIYNDGSTTVDLDGVDLVLVNGATLTAYNTVPLAPGGTLGPGEYLVVASSTVTVDPQATVILFAGGSSNVQNAGSNPDGPPGDAVALYDNDHNVVLDAVSYEAPVLAATIDGMMFDLIEGTPTTAFDTDSAPERSIIRFPNGADTDDNAADWAQTTQTTPGAANVIAEICANMVDDDGDMAVDCLDMDCAGSPACVEICDDMMDNDGDMLNNCADSDCDMQSCGPNGLVCLSNMCSCPGGATESVCNDNIDNDCDAQLDCADADCSSDPACLTLGITAVDYPVIAHGAQLVISGNGFTGATAVTIGGIAQMFTVNSDTQITVAALDDSTPVGATQPIVVTVPPNQSTPFNVAVVRLQINELDSDDAGADDAEFVEISTGGVSGVSLSGYVLVFWNGGAATNSSYLATNLAATTGSSGLLLVGNSAVVPAPAITFGNNLLQNGADAVTINQGTAASFPNGTALTAAGLIDAVVYGTMDADDQELMMVLILAGTQLDEGPGGPGGLAEIQSVQRCADGRRDLTKFVAATPPTPGVLQSLVCP